MYRTIGFTNKLAVEGVSTSDMEAYLVHHLYSNSSISDDEETSPLAPNEAYRWQNVVIHAHKTAGSSIMLWCVAVLYGRKNATSFYVSR